MERHSLWLLWLNLSSKIYRDNLVYVCIGAITNTSTNFSDSHVGKIGQLLRTVFPCPFCTRGKGAVLHTGNSSRNELPVRQARLLPGARSSFYGHLAAGDGRPRLGDDQH